MTRNGTVTASSLPPRHSSNGSLPPAALVSAVVMALPNATRASLVNFVPTPRITSPTWTRPSAGEPLSTLVTRIWRASVVTIDHAHIAPRSPVGPRFQSWMFLSPSVPPRVRSGTGGASLAPNAGPARRATIRTVRQGRPIRRRMVAGGMEFAGMRVGCEKNHSDARERLEAG